MRLALALTARHGITALTIIASAGFIRAADSIPNGWFVWPAVEPRNGSALDVSAFNLTPLQRITVRDGHFTLPDGTRVRFWGANLSGGEAYPATAKEAATIARRLAKGGVNIARLHHLDNPWGVGNAGSIWPANRPEHRALDSQQLDRLHRLIGALRDQGIYANINLKVSKSLVPEDGFDASVTKIPNFQKRVDIYDRRMIELQKDYARRLLTTKNPYTGLTPAEDPAVAVVEINNENSLLGFWTKDLGRGLDKLPPPFREELRTQWNTWLAAHYDNDAALASSWQPASAVHAESLIPHSARWGLSVRGGAAATITKNEDPTTLEIDVTAAAGIDWQVQTSLRGLHLKDGAVYTVAFEAKAAQPRKLGIGVGIDDTGETRDPWRSFGLLETHEVGTNWQTYQLVFPAHSVAADLAALNFNAGQAVGKISIRNIRLVEDCAGAGLQPGQSAHNATVPLPLTPSTAQWADWIHFLADTERAFAEEMRSFLKNELHVQAPIICSQIDYGGLTGMNRESSMEFADAHSYWQHPDFAAGADWDAKRWSIKNSPQVAEFHDRTFGELGVLALVRVAGKPFTISEYDHPAPSEFACEMYPEVSSFAARQDWDMVYPFCIGPYGKNNRAGSIQDFFDQLHHPAKWGQSPFAAVLFRRGLIAPASARRELRLGSPIWAEQPNTDVLWRQLVPNESLDFLNVAYGVQAQPGAVGEKASVVQHGEITSAKPVRLSQAPQGSVYVIDGDEVAAVVGFVGGTTSAATALTVACGRFGNDFASISAIALDHAALPTSRRVLVTVVGRAGNQGTHWNAARNSVGGDWGHGPTIAEHVPATITLSGSAARVVYALKPDGSRGQRIATSPSPAGLTFAVGPNDHTLHYEIVAPE